MRYSWERVERGGDTSDGPALLIELIFLLGFRSSLTSSESSEEPDPG